MAVVGSPCGFAGYAGWFTTPEVALVRADGAARRRRQGAGVVAHPGPVALPVAALAVGVALWHQKTLTGSVWRTITSPISSAWIRKDRRPFGREMAMAWVQP